MVMRNTWPNTMTKIPTRETNTMTKNIMTYIAEIFAVALMLLLGVAILSI